MTGPTRLDRTLIRVSGPDANSFLDNLLTQDVSRLDEAGVLYAALLSPQGKVLTDLILWGDGNDGIVLDVDPARGVDLLRRLSMYKLRAQVSLEEITGQFYILYSPTFFRGSQPDPRVPNGELGWREYCPLPSEQYDFPEGDSAYRNHLLRLGVPDLARDAGPDEVFALEALLDELNGVDFHKGCFVGQENVSRMKRRATTRKKFCPIVFEGEPPAYGTPVLAGAAELGSVRTGANGRALALLRLDRALAAEAPLTAGGKEIRLDPPDWLLLPPAAGAGD